MTTKSKPARTDGRMRTGKLAAAKPEPPPTGKGEIVLGLVKQDLDARAEMGERKYGTKLRVHNGRDSLMDAYQEALDLVMYLRQAIAESPSSTGPALASVVRAKLKERIELREKHGVEVEGTIPWDKMLVYISFTPEEVAAILAAQGRARKAE